MATQEERRQRTRRALLDAAAELFAARGVEGASVDAIALAADRTSGAVYDHFGSKEGLLFALLEEWVDTVSVVTGAELTTVSTLEERMAVLWRSVATPAVGERWIALEHELWSWATRNEDARRYLERRYRAAWASLGAGVAEWSGDRGETVGAAVVGLLLGLEMMRRVVPDAVGDDQAVAALCGVVTGDRTRAP